MLSDYDIKRNSINPNLPIQRIFTTTMDGSTQVKITIVKTTATRALEEINKETSIIKRLQLNPSDYIFRYIGETTQKIRDENFKFVIMETEPCLSLEEFIRRNPNRPPNVLWPIMFQLILGLQYIHNSGFANRNITSSKIFITMKGRIKYVNFQYVCTERCNFGFCRSTCKEPSRISQYYTAPEILLSQNDNSIEAVKAADIWSLMVVFFELANGTAGFPFKIVDEQNRNLHDQDLGYQIRDVPPYKSEYRYSQQDNDRTNRFLDSLVIVDWTKRPTINSLLIKFINEVYRDPWNFIVK